MKIDFGKTILNAEGTPFTDPRGKDLTLGYACFMAVDAFNPQEPLGHAERVKRGKLGLRIRAGGVANGDNTCDVTAEEITLIKECVGKFPFVTNSLPAQIDDLLEGNTPAVVTPIKGEEVKAAE